MPTLRPVSEPDDRLLQLAARQFGCVSVQQAQACGLGLPELRWRLRVGRLHRIGARVLRVVGSPPSWEQSLLAGLLDLGPTSVVSHRAAAALHGFEGFERGPIEFTVERARHGLRGPWRMHTTRTLEAIDRGVVSPFRCTSATRTIVDLARGANREELGRAIDGAVRDGWSSPTFLRKRLTALRRSGRAGVRLLDELLVDSGGHSPLERAFLELVRRAGLPRPACQRVYRRDGSTVARVDFDFAPRLVVVEVSGRRGHASDAERAKDAHRRNELQSLGLVVLEFTTDDIRNRPCYVLATLARHLA
jgi:very-short-patch-repair endonuclease